MSPENRMGDRSIRSDRSGLHLFPHGTELRMRLSSNNEPCHNPNRQAGLLWNSHFRGEPMRIASEGQVGPQDLAHMPAEPDQNALASISAMEVLTAQSDVPDRRWRQAQSILVGTATARGIDPLVRRLVKVVRSLPKANSTRKMRALLKRHGPIVRALQLHQDEGLEQRWLVEAYAFAGLTAEAIAQATGEPQEVVKIFLQVFFDLTDLLQRPVMLVQRAIGQIPGPAGEPCRWLWKLAALFGGRELLEAFIIGFDRHHSGKLLAKTEELIRAGIAIRAAAAAQSTAPLSRVDRDILKIHARHFGSAGNPEEDSNQPGGLADFMERAGEALRAASERPNPKGPPKITIPEDHPWHPSNRSKPADGSSNQSPGFHGTDRQTPPE